ncbi:hypothetical protein Vadar_028734 [Vaccinium darrowii]|uniref:Uncharacterized protein n=1 Tax=Vaccinium darrowii TaxID=229202 RepID=A0ACB7X4N5_9ERIC|nr:hypothetical protein Vadar_028734 [Vaccinium darrowii]
MKPGPTSERNYGLFKLDGTPAYWLGFNGSAAVARVLELKDQSKNLVFEKKEVTPEKVKGWSAALKEVASMAGVVSGKESNGTLRYEAELIKEIVGVLKSKLSRKHRSVDNHLRSVAESGGIGSPSAFYLKKLEQKKLKASCLI